MNGGGEGSGRKTDWGLAISIAALLFGAVQWWGDLNDDSEAKAVTNAERLTAMRSDLNAIDGRVDNLECRAGVTCIERIGR